VQSFVKRDVNIYKGFRAIPGHKQGVRSKEKRPKATQPFGLLRAMSLSNGRCHLDGGSGLNIPFDINAWIVLKMRAGLIAVKLYFEYRS